MLRQVGAGLGWLVHKLEQTFKRRGRRGSQALSRRLRGSY